MSPRTLLAWGLLGVLPVKGGLAAPTPIVRTSLSPRSVTVGQPVTLTVDVFVPTFFTSAPRFPTLEVKDAVVIFDPEGTNLTERIGEADWAGQRRSYQIFPQRPGRFEVDPFEVRVRFSVDGQPSPRTGAAARGGAFEATVPEAAKGLAHFVATSALTLEQDTDRSLDGLRVGDSVTRTITVTAVDAFAMMLPPLTFARVDGLAVYPASPRVSDTSGERETVRMGKRVETATYVLQKPGSYHLPALEVAWWDTGARVLRRATAPELAFDVAPAPAVTGEIPLPPDTAAEPPPPSLGTRLLEVLRRYGAPLLLGLAAVLAVGRGLLARLSALRDRRAAQRRRREESPGAYAERLRKSVGGPPAALLAAAYRWLDRRPGAPASAARLDEFTRKSGNANLPTLATAVVESALQGGTEAAPQAQAFAEALLGTDPHRRPGPSGPNALGPLNPDHPTLA